MRSEYSLMVLEMFHSDILNIYHHCLAIYNIISLPPSLLSLLTETIPEVSWGSMKHVIEYPFGMCHHLALFLFTKKDNEELVGKAGQRISIGAYHCFLWHQGDDLTINAWAGLYLTVPWQIVKNSREISNLLAEPWQFEKTPPFSGTCLYNSIESQFQS